MGVAWLVGVAGYWGGGVDPKTFLPLLWEYQVSALSCPYEFLRMVAVGLADPLTYMVGIV